MSRPWAKLAAADRVEAVRELLKTTAPSAIARKLKAPKNELDRIVALIRREGWKPTTNEPAAAADTAGDYLREPAAAVPGQIIREGDAPRETGRRQGGVASCPDTELSEESREGRKPAELQVSTPAPTWAQMSGTARRKACLDGRKSGLSATVIAAQFGTTRNSVIGYWKRASDSGVPLPSSAHGNGPKKVAAPKLPTIAQAKKPLAPKPTVNSGALALAVKSKLRLPDQAVIARENAFEPIPGTTPISLMECGPRNCRFAVDGIKGPSLLFCGQPKELDASWCPAHRLIVFQPVERRRRAEETERKAA